MKQKIYSHLSIVILLAGMVLIPSVEANAGGFSFINQQDSWDKMEYSLYASYIIGSLIDVSQTNYAIEHDGVELNPIYGKAPSRQALYGVKAGASLLVLYCAHQMPRKYRKATLWLLNGIQWGVVAWNGAQPGVGFNLSF